MGREIFGICYIIRPAASADSVIVKRIHELSSKFV